MPGELQHIVAVAALAGLLRNVSRDRSRLRKIFPVRIAPDDIAVVAGHGLPEEARSCGMRRLARQLVQARKAYQLRDLRVCVQPRKRTPALGKWIKDLPVAKPLRQGEPVPVARA